MATEKWNEDSSTAPEKPKSFLSMPDDPCPHFTWLDFIAAKFTDRELVDTMTTHVANCPWNSEAN